MAVHEARLIVSVAIFLATLVVVIWQPRGLGIGWSALAGAVVALAAGVVDLTDIARVWDIVWNATFTFVAVILISLLLDAAGFFKWAALHVARVARGDGRLLFGLVVVLGALVAAVFANDGAALILTPIVMEMLLALGYPPAASLAFVMATGFIADSTSLPLVVSNLVNIVSADYFHIGFARFTAVMAPIDLVSVAASLSVLWIYFNKHIQRHYKMDKLEQPSQAISDLVTFRVGWVVLLVVLAGYFLAGALHLPISVVAGGGALVLACVAGRWWVPLAVRIHPALSGARGRPEQLQLGATGSAGKEPSAPIPVLKIVREAPWQVVLFSLGMYLVVFGMGNAGLTSVLAALLGDIARRGNVLTAVSVGYGAAGMSSAMNNMPSVLVGALSIHASKAVGSAHEAMIYANVIGCDLGPKLTPIGSLATLLWLHVLDKRGMHIGWGYYVRTGFALTLPVLAITLLALAGWLHVLG